MQLDMDLIYLDYNCFQRGFDDLRQIRIQMEALACQAIFVGAEADEVRCEPADYVEISRRLYEGQTIDEIFDRAREHWKE